ncbi:MAG: site-specific integrase [Candidatus Hydrogenedentales bacterium]|jgi:integrase
MARPTGIRKTLPSLRRHQTPQEKAHDRPGRAFVELDGHRHYLGPWGTPEADQRYRNTLAEWIAADRRAPVSKDEITIIEVCDRFWSWALNHYRTHDGRHTSEIGMLKSAVSILKTVYGRELAADFGPLKLKAIQRHLIDSTIKRRGTPEAPVMLSRSTINKYIDRVRRVFKWAASEELIPASVHDALKTVSGVRAGRTEARETAPVEPVDMGRVEATLKHLPRQLVAVVRMQLLTGARPSEILTVRPCDVNTSGDVWEIRPEHHKGSHRGHARVVYVGPQGQEVLRPFLLRERDAYCFSPAEAEIERLAARHAARETPMSQGNVPGSNRKTIRQRKPRDYYDASSYRRAIERACEDAKVVAWNPYQLRHTAATMIRAKYGLEAAQAVLGHAELRTTQVYAEADRAKALEVAKAIG